MSRWRQHADEHDHELAAVFSRAGSVPGPDEATLARAYARVAAGLRAPRVETRSAPRWRRFAVASMGGGGAWLALIGAAAAHKAVAAAVGLSVLVGGTLAAGAMGVGPGVAEEPRVESQRQPAAEVRAAGAEPARARGGAVTVEPAPEGLPGNLVSHLRDSGVFTARGRLGGVDGDLVTIETAEGTWELPLAGDAVIRAPGAVPEEPDVSAFVGHLAFVLGACDQAATTGIGAGCEITAVHVLGFAGMVASLREDAGQPEGAGRPEEAAATAERRPAGSTPEAAPAEAPKADVAPASAPPEAPPEEAPPAERPPVEAPAAAAPPAESEPADGDVAVEEPAATSPTDAEEPESTEVASETPLVDTPELTQPTLSSQPGGAVEPEEPSSDPTVGGPAPRKGPRR